MNALHYVWRSMRHRYLLSLLTIFAVMVTVALFALLLMSQAGVEQSAEKGYGPFDLVVGADGSDTQLVLSTFYRVGAPVDNIPLSVLEDAKNSSEAQAAFGVTMGDNHDGYRIIGVDAAYFPTRYENRKLSQGRLYSQLGEVTVGYSVAKALHLKVGDTFAGAHGLVEHGVESFDEGEEEGHDEHASFSYRVVGILPKLNTPDDRGIFTTMEYAWAVHPDADEHKEVTAILIKPRSLMGAQTMKLKYDAIDHVQAVYSSKAIADVLNMVDSGSQLLSIVMLVCMLLSAVTLLLALIASIQEKQREVGLLRLIGKSRMYIMSSLVGEGLMLTALGVVFGLLLGHLLAALFSDAVFAQTGVLLQAWNWADGETLLVLAALLVGAVASLGPSLKVYQSDALTLFKA
ncbi:FtsX-like permease family protein [Paenibacillus sp. HB172176]|uniref:ABC transporter permease n=1 Tax=Paenibacillus sp. HB172176 TaxID=2493690 RepID=UPI0014386E1D|nr:FtsX-like permease family protein [Paenibacillus sp. HB172176]